MPLESAQAATAASEATASTGTNWSNLQLLKRKQRISLQDRLFFTEQLSLLLESGMQSHTALQLVARQCSNATLRSTIEQAAESVAGGNALSAALQEHPEVFDASYTRLVAASEGGGYLAKVLQQLQQTDERAQALRNTLVSAFTYPMILLVFSFGVIVFMLVYVFPKFSKLFAGLGDDLPATTRILMGVSDVLTHHWAWVIAGIVGLLALVNYWRASPIGQDFIDNAKLNWPGLRSIYQRYYMSRSMQVMGLSLSNGVSVVDTLESCRDATNNRQLQLAYGSVSAKILEGGRLSDAFSELRSVPQLAKEMIMTAEESGNLGTVALRIAQYYEQELNRLLERFAKIVEPVMLLIMGTVVGLIVSSLLLPVFKLSQTIH